MRLFLELFLDLQVRISERADEQDLKAKRNRDKQHCLLAQAQIGKVGFHLGALFSVLLAKWRVFDCLRVCMGRLFENEGQNVNHGENLTSRRRRPGLGSRG